MKKRLKELLDFEVSSKELAVAVFSTALLTAIAAIAIYNGKGGIENVKNVVKTPQGDYIVNFLKGHSLLIPTD